MSFCVVRPVAIILPAALLLCGCGSGQLETAPVRGTVTCGGQPLTSGTVSFSPVVGEGESAATAARPAMGAVQPDGSFVLSTYEANDGALIGKHVVTYMPLGEESREGEEGDEEDGAAVPALPPPPVKRGQKVPCRFGGTTEVEVVDGENVLEIDLSELGRDGEEGDESGAY